MSEVLESPPIGPAPGALRFTIRNRHDPKLSFETNSQAAALMHLTMGNAVYDRDVPISATPEQITKYRAALFRDTGE